VTHDRHPHRSLLAWPIAALSADISL